MWLLLVLTVMVVIVTDKVNHYDNDCYDEYGARLIVIFVVLHV